MADNTIMEFVSIINNSIVNSSINSSSINIINVKPIDPITPKVYIDSYFIWAITIYCFIPTLKVSGYINHCIDFTLENLVFLALFLDIDFVL